MNFCPCSFVFYMKMEIAVLYTRTMVNIAYNKNLITQKSKKKNQKTKW